MSVQEAAAVGRLEDVADAGVRDPPAAVGADAGVDVGRVGRVDGDRGDVAVREAARDRACHVPPSFVAMPREKAAPGLQGPHHAAYVTSPCRRQRGDLVAVSGVEHLLPVAAARAQIVSHDLCRPRRTDRRRPSGSGRGRPSRSAR